MRCVQCGPGRQAQAGRADWKADVMLYYAHMTQAMHGSLSSPDYGPSASTAAAAHVYLLITCHTSHDDKRMTSPGAALTMN